MGEVTGLCDVIYDKDGKEVTVKLDFGDTESAVIFRALQEKRIYGTEGFQDYKGLKWQQVIYLEGEFSSEKNGVREVRTPQPMRNSETFA